MEIQIKTQLTALLLAFFLGSSLGIVYDIIRPLRYKMGKTAAAADGLFAILSGLGLFFYAMQAESGRMGLWELVAALLGFLAYLNSLSNVIQKMEYEINKILYSFSKKIKNILKKLKNLQKMSLKKNKNDLL